MSKNNLTRVRAKMYEGLNFGRAVVAVLADVPREDDPSALRKKEQIAAQQKLIDLGKMREAIRRKLQKSLTLMPANSRTIKISSPIQSSEIVGTKPPIVS